MKIWRDVVVVGLCLCAGATGGVAQTTATLANAATVSLDGLTGPISGLSCPTSGCTSGDQLEVVAVSPDNLAFEIVTSSASSSIFAASNGKHTETETLSHALTVPPTTGSGHKIGSPKSVTQAATGHQNLNNCSPCANDSATASSVFAGSTVPSTPLLSTLAQGGSAQVTNTSITDPLSSVANPFTITTTLNLSNSGDVANSLKFNAFALQLHTVAEPATVSVLLVSLGGLLAARRRRLRR